jgi:hypothetical protein
MTFRGCAREHELQKLLDRGQWPAACPGELRAHVAHCRSCREMILVSHALGSERLKAAAEARLESPGVLWWRAQMRRRHAALERISRPFLGAQIFALAVCLVSAGFYILAQARRGFDWLAWLADLPRTLHLGALMPGSLMTWVAISLAAALAVTGGAIVYLASGETQESGIRGQGSDRRI